MANYIIENGKRITYTIKDGEVVYSDGKVAVPSVDNIDIKKAYTTAKAPIVDPPKEEPPVVIPPGVPQEPDTRSRSISMSELEKSNGLNGENLLVVTGNYNGEYFFSNLKNTRVEFLGSVFGAKESNAIQLRGDCSGLELYGGIFKGVRGKCINYEIEDNVHVKGLKLTDMIFDTISQEVFDGSGWIDKSGVLGILEDLVINGCKVINSPNAGTLIRSMAAENFQIINNEFQNISTKNANHNGICMLQGNGLISGNRVQDIEGSFVRMAPCQVAGTGKVLKILNNWIVKSKGYSAFEFQVMTDGLKESGRYKPADTLIQNNTAGLLNHVIDGWSSLLLDLYELGNTNTIKDNLLFETYNNGITGTMVHYVNATKATKVIESGNKYVAKAADAIDLTTFKSKIAGVGALTV